MKDLQVSAIKDGVVIDHIPQGQTFKIVELLNLKKYDEVVTVAFNLKSGSLKKKGLIKITDLKLSDKDLNKIAILAPSATVNYITDYEVTEKVKLDIPDVIDDIIKCGNIKCISNHESIPSKFLKLGEKTNLIFKCFYCERAVHEESIFTK